jgi:uncharacterized surface protein with fasciclin (FAS1) repeats
MFNWFKKLSLVVTLGSAALLSACGGGSDDDHPASPASTQAKNIVDTAKADARFSVLVEAVRAADPSIAAALSGPGPLTVFAPTNDAFAALLTELGVNKAQLLENKPLLDAVLRYHVLGAKVLKAQVGLGRQIAPLAGGIFKVDQIAADLVINDGRNRKSTIILTDLAASNGVIHAIDKVLLPADKNIVQTAQALAAGSPSQFTFLVDAVVAANLVDTLSGPGPFTVFAPTDAAFDALLIELGLTDRNQLLTNTELLTKVLTYHVLSGTVLKAEVPVGSAITSVQGDTFTVSPTLSITDARARTANIIATDTLTSNGVIHVIDKVILPRP